MVEDFLWFYVLATIWQIKKGKSDKFLSVDSDKLQFDDWGRKYTFGAHTYQNNLLSLSSLASLQAAAATHTHLQGE